MTLKTDNKDPWPQVEYQIDEEDYERVSKYKWYFYGGYILRTESPYGSVYLHVFIMGYPPKELQWDHINRDKLDNRKENLRLATPIINTRNSSLKSTNTTGHIGVSIAEDGRYRAQIQIKERSINLGRHNTLEEAVAARKTAEEKYWN